MFEPKIIAFLCNWCSYAGSDIAGVSRMQYPPNIRIIRVMCSGRVDIAFILQALLSGIDGILIAGCHPGECHYIDGNLKAERRVNFLKELLKNIGIEPERVKITWISASEGKKFQETAKEFTEFIRSMGPNPLKLKKVNVKFDENKREFIRKIISEICGKRMESDKIIKKIEDMVK